MRHSPKRSLRLTWVLGAAEIALLTSAAHAQDTATGSAASNTQTNSDGVKSEDIIVTGTLIRGTGPIGSNDISLGQAKIEEVAPISTNQLLASIPQVSNYFNRNPLADVGGVAPVNQIQISRPNLRNISPSNASSNATLILVDGHRIASAGVNQASIDPDVIPVGAIDHVEVVTEGGSATYGADAVAGVINFITRKRFDGLKIDSHYGVADSYWQWDATATDGKDWGTGSAYVSLTYSKNDSLYGRDRDFIHNLDYATPYPYLGHDTACANPNLAVNTVIPAFGVTVASVNYAAPGYVANTSNRCDNSQNSTYVPRAIRKGLLAGFTQDLDDRTSINIRAFYSEKTTDAFGDYTGSVAVGSGNPYSATLPSGLVLGPTTITIPGIGTLPAVNQAAVSFNLSPLLGANAETSGTRIKEWGVNAELSHDIGSTWQVRGLLNWSGSDSSYYIRQLSPTRLATAGSATTPATAFNPFDVTNNNSALVSDLTDSEIAGQAKDDLVDLRLIAEGKLFELPGGDVRLAFGYEFMDDRLEQRFSSDVRVGGLSAIPFATYNRTVNSAFGELRLPILADGRGGSMLTVSASGRYDDYSDFGHTFNPKIGANFKPLPWINIRGNWGTSFTAPTPIDQLGSLRNTVSPFPFVAFTKPGETAPGGAYTVALQGSVPDLKPQTAHTWSVGADLTPIPRLRVSGSYYSVNFKNIIETPEVDSNIVTNYPNNIFTNPNGFSAAQLTAFGALAPGGDAVVQSLINSGTLVYELVDFRVANFGGLKVTGVDFSLNYQQPTGFGSLDLTVSGNRPLSRQGKVSPTSAVTDELATDYPKLYLQTGLGADIGHFRGQVTWNYNGGYAIAATPANQTHVSSFSTVDLFFKYDVPATGPVFGNLSFTLNVQNVADQNPPILLRNFTSDLGFTNGFTLGRMFIFGVSKKF